MITYYGEVYNFQVLRKKLKKLGHQFRSRSDTEVMLVSFIEWGVEESLKKFDGMFAFALWDRKEKKLDLCRDRIGEKPLYYGWIKNKFVFSSELNALRSLPFWNEEINWLALNEYQIKGYIPAPLTIYKNIRKLLPAHKLSINCRNKKLSSEAISHSMDLIKANLKQLGVSE